MYFYMSNLKTMRLTPFSIAFIYFLCSVFWILFSDNLLHELQQQQGINDIMPLYVAKGLFFITVTALLIFYLAEFHEKKLRRSLENYQNLFESSPFPIYIVDLSTLNFVAVNDACTRQYGYTRDEFLSLNLRDIRPHEDIPILENAISKNSTGFVDAGHWRHIKKSGELLHVHVTYHHVTFSNRPCILVLPQEISSQLKAEQKVGELVKELSEFKNAISSASLLIIANHEGKIEFMNPNLEKLSQHTYAAKIGKLFTEVATGLRDKEFNTQMWNCMNKGEVWKGELHHSKKDDTKYWTECFVIPITTNEGIISKLVIIQSDITERKHSEELVNESNKHLSEIAWISSHQLRHPVSNLMGLCELLKFPLSEKEEKDVKVSIETELKRLDDMIRLIVEKTYLLKDVNSTLKK